MNTQGQPGSQGTRYYSKKDTWIMVLIGAALLLPFILMFYFLTVPGIPAWVIGELLFIGLVVVALIASLSLTYYEITPSTLIVRSGPLHREIPLASIQRVFPTRNPLSAPAWSLDRLQVDYTKDSQTRFVLISPKDKLGFLHDLAQTAGDLEVIDGRAVRR